MNSPLPHSITHASGIDEGQPIPAEDRIVFRFGPHAVEVGFRSPGQLSVRSLTGRLVIKPVVANEVDMEVER
jgi:hypothetical protein